MPWDLEDRFFNVFNIPIRADGMILADLKLPEDRWTEVILDWNTSRRECRIALDGHPLRVVPCNRRSNGLNYLRVRSIATKPDGGVLIRSLCVTVNGLVTASEDTLMN